MPCCIWGVGFDPFTPEALADPYPLYARFRAADPVHWSEKLRSWVLFRYDDVAEFFRDDRRLSSDRAKAAKFTSRAAGQAMPSIRTVASDPPAHTPVRAMLTATLNPRVRGMAGRIDVLIDGLLDAIARASAALADRLGERGDIDLISAFAYPLPIEVIAELLDVPSADRMRFQGASAAIARGMDRFYSGRDAAAGLQELGAYFLQLAGTRRDGPGGDLIRALIAAEHHGDRLSELEVVAMCTALVFGGHETTVNLLGNGMLALLRCGAQRAQLCASPAAIESAVEELLRFDSPAQFISRTAVVECTWGGQPIRSGDAVLACLGAANRDPAVFPEPDRLDVMRRPNPHLAFGLGTHFCPGAQLSRMEARAAIPALLQRFPRLRLGDSPPVRRPTAVLRGLERLPVRVE
jgi:cytochrome P450